MNQKATVRRIEGTVMKVNSYVIEHPAGAVVVDGMLSVTDARAVRAHLDATKLPILGAVVTHAHPDHYAGLAELLRGHDVPVYATPAVSSAIQRDDAVKNAIVGPMLGTEWPAERRFPDREVTSGATAVFADGAMELRVRDLGPGESPADSIWSLDQHTWFVGDLVYNGMHAYLADGHYAAWLQVLARLEQELEPDATLYVGHGAPGAPKALIETQRRYVQAFVQSVERHRQLAPEPRRASVVADMRRLLPTDDLLFLMELSVDPVAATLR